MSRLDTALVRLAERGEPIGAERLLESLDGRLSIAPGSVIDHPTRRSTMQTNPPSKPSNRSRAVIAVAAAAVVAIVAIVSVIVLDSGESDEAAARIATIEEMVSAYNTGDIDQMMAFFAEETEITGHPFRIQSVSGLDAIRTLMGTDRDLAASIDPYTISNVEADGNTVTWDHRWRNASGQQYCGEGHRTVVEDGKILSWQFSAEVPPAPCP